MDGQPRPSREGVEARRHRPSQRVTAPSVSARRSATSPYRPTAAPYCTANFTTESAAISHTAPETSPARPAIVFTAA